MQIRIQILAQVLHILKKNIPFIHSFSKLHWFKHEGEEGDRPVLWIRIRSDPELFEGSGSGSGINSFGSGSFLIPNFCVKKSHFFNKIAQKIGKFSTYIYVHIKYVFVYM
jgi:hypothetical protein